MPPRRTASALVALLLLASAVPSIAASPSLSASPEPTTTSDITQSERALELVRGMDARFKELPTFDDIKYLITRDGSFGRLYAGSWLDVLDSRQQAGESLDLLGWMDIGGRIVEVMLVAECVPDPEGAMREDQERDPCLWRHTWRYLVTPEGSVTLVFEAGSPDDGRPGTWQPLPSRAP